MAKYKVLITDYVWPTTEPEETVLREEADAEAIVAPNGDEDTLISLAGDVDAIMTCFAQVTPAVLRAAPKCVAVGRFGVGVDNIAVDTATELGMAVTYVPDYCVDEVSDHVLALLLGWNRRVGLFDNSVKTDGWGSVALTMRMMRLRGKTLGVVGFGRIGQAVAEKARAFGFRILAHDPYMTAEQCALRYARKTDLDTLLAESDFVTLHSPLNAETEKMIGERELGLMKPESFLINCARGPLDRRRRPPRRPNFGWRGRHSRRGLGRDGGQSPVQRPPPAIAGQHNHHPPRSLLQPRGDAGTGTTRRPRSRLRPNRQNARQPSKPRSSGTRKRPPQSGITKSRLTRNGHQLIPFAPSRLRAFALNS